MCPSVGSFGAVYLCRKTNTGERKAVKVFFRGDEKVCVSSNVLLRGLQQEKSKEPDIKVGMIKELDLSIQYKVLMPDCLEGCFYYTDMRSALRTIVMHLSQWTTWKTVCQSNLSFTLLFLWLFPVPFKTL
jgi:hypothetical protein